MKTKRITAAEHVKIDDNDVRQVIDVVEDSDLEALNEMRDSGELELAPGLVGWGRYNFTARHQETNAAYHVRIE